MLNLNKNHFFISFPGPVTLQEIEIKGGGLIDVMETISKQASVQPVT